MLLQNLQLRNLLGHLLDAMLGLHDSNLSLQHLLHLLASCLLLGLLQLLLIHGGLRLALDVYTRLDLPLLCISHLLLLTVSLKLSTFSLR